jgi:O-antigen ligase
MARLRLAPGRRDVSTSLDRVGIALRLPNRAARLLVIGGLAALVMAVALATRLNVLPMAVAIAAAGLLTLASLRWPLIGLFAFTALIPIEQVLLLDSLGTLTRLAGVLFAVTYGVPRIGRLALGAMPIAAWGFLAWAIVSLTWAVDPTVAWAELPTLIQLFLIALLVADVVAQQPALVRPLLWVYSLSASATALLGIVAYLGSGIASGGRAAALEDQNPAQFAAILLPAFVFGLYEVLKGSRRMLGGVITLLTTIGLVVSGTRGAWLAMAVVAALFVFPQLRPRQRIAALAVMGVLAFATLMVPGVGELVSDRASSALSTGGAGRTDIWSVATTIYKSAPVLGVGFANFPVAYTQDAVRASDVTAWYHLQGRAPHNVAIGTLIELGPVGLLLLAAFVLPLVIRRGWGPDAATVQAALASLMTLALFLDIVGNRKQVWLVIGIAAGLAFVAQRNRAPSEPQPQAGATSTGHDAVETLPFEAPAGPRRTRAPWRRT